MKIIAGVIALAIYFFAEALESIGFLSVLFLLVLVNIVYGVFVWFSQEIEEDIVPE